MAKKSHHKKHLDLARPETDEQESLNTTTQISSTLNHTLDLEQDEPIFALPSEEHDRGLHGILVNDGYLKNDSIKVIKKGSKHNTESNSTEISHDEFNSRPKSFIGRKGATKWSKNIENLRDQFGFSWQRLGRKFAVFSLVFGIIAVITTTGVAAAAIDYWNKTPSITDIDRDPAESSVVYARDGTTKIYEFYDEAKREVIDNIKDIPPAMRTAIIALEDENYWDSENNTGIPWKNLAGALRDCLITGGDNCRGASGISQQLIKNITTEDEQTTDRKLKELFTAVKLNQSAGKSEILLKYLNWVPFGRNAYGVQEASKAYLGKLVNEKDAAGEFTLTPPEACYLASMVQSPTYYSSEIDKVSLANLDKQKVVIPVINPISSQPTVGTEIDDSGETSTTISEIPAAAKALEARKDACLDKMRELRFPINDEGTLGNFIETDLQLEIYKNQPVVSVKDVAQAQRLRAEGKMVFVTVPVDDPYPHFREYITKELTKFMSDRQLRTEGYKIITTLDPGIQQRTDAIVKGTEPLIRQNGANNGAAMVLDGPTGQIIAMVGSLGYNRDEIDGKVNIATSAQQPGSSVKPYVYSAAFKNGFNPGTVVQDTKTTWDGYTPFNFDRNFRGPVTMRRALQGSLNIPAVKTLFLGNDNPQSDRTSKLDTYFSYTESLGVKYPCIEGASNILFATKNNGIETCTPKPNVDPALAVTQEDIDNAYRGRCYLASALGGCELTMVSHIGAMNSLFENAVRTPSPFLSIIKKSSGEDIYATKQKSSKPVYPQAEFDDEMKLISRQITNVMTDYNSRIPEFGSTRFNLQLNDPRWRVAAKSGTSNGPKDLWTVGGTPYFAVSVWIGNTDDAAMNFNASSGTVATGMWKSIMENIHAGLAPKNFPTDGLIPYSTPSGNELLTPKQIEQIKGKGGRVAINSPDDLVKFKQRTIFENRTTLVPVSYNINALDGGLFVDGLTLPANKKEVQCNALVSEFTEDSWRLPVEEFVNTKKPADTCILPTPSTQNQIGQSSTEPTVVTNIASGNNPIATISASASYPGGFSKSVSKISILSGSTVLATSNSSSITTPAPTGTTSTITIAVTDNLGNVYNTVFNSVTFATPVLSTADITLSSCTPASPAGGSTTVCTFSFTSSISTAGVTAKVQIGTAPSANCSVGSGTITCSAANVPVSPGVTAVNILLNGGFAVQKGTVTVVLV
jgi:membrane peptidoglycan carboxypeptidase